MFCLAKKHLGPSDQSLGLKSPWHGVCSLQTPHLEPEYLLNNKAKIMVGLGVG